jgi:hypothetical protein
MISACQSKWGSVAKWALETVSFLAFFSITGQNSFTDVAVYSAPPQAELGTVRQTFVYYHMTDNFICCGCAMLDFKNDILSFLLNILISLYLIALLSTVNDLPNIFKNQNESCTQWRGFLSCSSGSPT